MRVEVMGFRSFRVLYPIPLKLAALVVATLERMKVIAHIRPTEIREIEAEGDDYNAARDAVIGQIPEGWQLLSVTTVR